LNLDVTTLETMQAAAEVPAPPKPYRKLSEVWREAGPRLCKLRHVNLITPAALTARLEMLNDAIKKYESNGSVPPPTVLQECAFDCAWTMATLPQEQSQYALDTLELMAEKYWMPSFLDALQHASVERAMEAYEAGLALMEALDFVYSGPNKEKNPMLKPLQQCVDSDGDEALLIVILAREPINHASAALAGCELPRQSAAMDLQAQRFQRALIDNDKCLARHSCSFLRPLMRNAIAHGIIACVPEFLNEMTCRTAEGRGCAEAFVLQCLDYLTLLPEAATKFRTDTSAAFAAAAIEATKLEPATAAAAAPAETASAQSAKMLARMDIVRLFGEGSMDPDELMNRMMQA
jgi:hypothetical protein